MPNYWAITSAGPYSKAQSLPPVEVALLTRINKHEKGKKRASLRAVALNFEALVQSLPHALVVVDGENRIAFANLAAEEFFGASEPVLKKRALHSVLAFAHPLTGLADQVRQTRQTVNEYELELSMPDRPSQVIDVFASLLSEDGDLVMLMLQRRSMANMIERQLSHRGAARSVSAMAAVLAHEIKNPLSGIRGAAQLLEAGAAEEDRPLAQLIVDETSRIRDLVDRMEVFGDERPLNKEPVNIHTVLDHVRRIAHAGFGRNIAIAQVLRPEPARGAWQSRQAHSGVSEPREEQRGGHRRPAGRANHAVDGVPPRLAHAPGEFRGQAWGCRSKFPCPTTGTACRRM